MALRDRVRGNAKGGKAINNRQGAMELLGVLARQLALFAPSASTRADVDLAPTPVVEHPPEKPVEHLRRAIASARGISGAIPDPQVYSELRLLLNQIESGRVSPEPSRALAPPRRVLQKKPQRRLSVRVLSFARRVADRLH